MSKITIDGVVYVPEKQKNENGEIYSVVRTHSAGVFAGYVKERNGREVILTEATRLWSWSGAFTLSQISIDGVQDPDDCKFALTVEEILLLEAIEIIPCTEKARKSITDVKKHEYKS